MNTDEFEDRLKVPDPKYRSGVGYGITADNGPLELGV
jgi:hypothetical protein